MSAARTCPQCGSDLPDDLLEGLCPKCVVRFSLQAPSVPAIPSPDETPTLKSAIRNPQSAIATLRYFGDYELLEEIARGGMGVVYKARQVSLNRIVAVKMILAGQLASAEDVQRFRAEAEAAANLKHPNIVAIHEVGEHEGQHYFSMDFIEGQSLSEQVRDGPLPAQRAARYVQIIAEAIHYAHQRGTLHRDLKPSNVLIDAYDQPQVTDFGLAKRLKGDSELTLTGQVLGSPNYMPPEQATANQAQIGPPSDIYSLGALLYHLLAGRPPFVAETIHDTLIQVVNAEPLAPRLLNASVPRDLDTICLKCLEKAPAGRYRSAQELAEELGRFLCDEPIRARPISRTEKLWRLCRRKPAVATALGVALLFFLIIVIGSPMMTMRIDRQRQRAEQQTHRAQAALTRVEIERAESLFTADNPSPAIASLARLLRQAPTNRVVAERLLSALSSRHFCLPSAPPLRHRAKVNCAQFSPDGQLAVTASLDGTARVWDIRTGEPVGEALRHGAEVEWARFSPDSRRVVTASLDGTARVWDAQSGQPISRPLRHEDAVLSADFSPDGRRVVTASNDKTVRLWNAESGAPISPIITNQAEVYFVCFSPDGNNVLAAVNDEKARIFSCIDGARLASFSHWKRGATPFPQYDPKGERVVVMDGFEAVIWDIRGNQSSRVHFPHRYNLTSVAFSPDGKLVATASGDNTARVWNARTGAAVTPALKHDDGVDAVRFNSDGTLLITGGTDKSARVWDVRTGQPFSEPLQHEAPVTSVQFSPDNHRVLTLTDGTEAALWWTRSTRTRPLVLKHQFEVRLAVFSADGRQVATASWDKTARVWNARTGLPLTDPLKQAGLLNFVRFSPDGERVATVSDRKEVQIWNVTTGEPLLQADERCRTRDIRHFQFSRDGKRMVIATFQNGAWVCDAATGEIISHFGLTNTIFGSTNTIHCALFSPDGQRVVTASNDKTARVWDARTGQALTEPLRHDGSVVWVDFSPDGQRVITASRDKTARIWDAATGQILTKPLVHADGLNRFHSVQFSADGRRVVTAAGTAARVWDAQSGDPVSPLLENRGRVTSIRFSPDGRRLVSAAFGDQPRVWDAVTGHLLSEPLRHREGCHYAEFSPDGEFVVTASADSTAAIWWIPIPPLQSPSWLPALAEALVGRQIDEVGSTVLVPVETLFRLVRRLGEEAKNDYYGRWVTSFLSGDATRLLSPSHPQAVTLVPAARSPVAPKQFPLRDPAAPASLIDLTAFFNAAFEENWHNKKDPKNKGNNLSNLARGRQKLDGVEFDVRGIVQISSQILKNLDPSFPQKVEGIPIARQCKQIHFLHATSLGMNEDTPIGTYLIHYTAGPPLEVPIVYGQDLRRCWSGETLHGPASRASLAWLGKTGRGDLVRLFKRTWDNPRPDSEIKSIDFVSKMTDSAPFLIAITVE